MSKPGMAAGTDLATYLKVSPEFVSTIELPLGARLERAGETAFVVVLPRMNFFDIWLQPVADAIVLYVLAADACLCLSRCLPQSPTCFLRVMGTLVPPPFQA